eukprot:9462129-Heterocapsa_arctica.AAC.1
MKTKITQDRGLENIRIAEWLKTIRITSFRNRKKRRPPSNITREGWTNKSKEMNKYMHMCMEDCFTGMQWRRKTQTNK